MRYMKDGMVLDSPLMNDQSDGCLAMGKGTTEKNISYAMVRASDRGYGGCEFDSFLEI